jgi:hypothetical protein
VIPTLSDARKKKKSGEGSCAGAYYVVEREVERDLRYRGEQATAFCSKNSMQHAFWTLLVIMDGNGRKNPISTSVSIFFGGNGSEFGKYGFENGIGICGHTETDKYGWRTKKLN